MCQKTSSENVVLSSKRRTSKTRANNQDFRINVVVFFLSPVGVLLRENNQAFCLHLHQAPCRLRLIIRTFFFTSPFSLPRFISKGKFYLTGSNFIFE